MKRFLPALLAFALSLAPKHKKSPMSAQTGDFEAPVSNCPEMGRTLFHSLCKPDGLHDPDLHRRGRKGSGPLRTIAPLLAAVISLAVLLPAFGQTAFLEVFNGRPVMPQPWDNASGWDLMVLGVDSRQPNLAQHGPNCEPPGFPYSATNSHRFSTAAEAVFICNDHLMTSLGLSGYGAVYMTPPAVLDLSSGSGRISWDQSTLRTSSRDWVYVTITPFAERHEMAFINTDQHIPRHVIKIELGGANTFLLFQNGGFSNSRIQQADDFTPWEQVFRAQTPPTDQSATRRDTFEIQLSRTHISLCMPDYAYAGQQPFCWARNSPLREALDPAIWPNAAVQWTHVTYNAEKSCTDQALAAGIPADQINDVYNIAHNAYGDVHCPPNTWHWDDFSISPSIPYSVIASNPPDFTSSSGSPFRVNFVQPAPAGSSLSFVSFGTTDQLRVSYDNGATWLVPSLQATNRVDQAGEHVIMPIPTGQTSVMVRGAVGWWGGFNASTFKIVVPPGGPQPTLAPTLTPTATPTLAPATATAVVATQTAIATQTAVAAATATAIATLTPTMTPFPTPEPTILVPTPTETPVGLPTATPTVEPTQTPTATPAPVQGCQVKVRLDGVEGEWLTC